MENPIISIVVPLYNCERFIPRLAKSLLPQLSKEVELILVNDGSTDKTPQMCDELANKHKYVRVVHKKNGGLSSARNAGIDASMGKYISFVDGDDIMENGAYEKLLTVIKTWAPDMIDFGWKYISSTGEEKKNFHGIIKNILLDKQYVQEYIIPPLINLKKDDVHNIFPFSCMKIFKRDILFRYNLRFDETRRIWEDQPFVVSYLKHVKSCYCLDDCLYCYMDTPGSLSRTYTTDFFNIIIKNYQLYKSLFEGDYDFETQYVYDYWRNAIVNMIFRSFAENDKQEEIENVIKETLSNAQVVAWFERASVSTRLEKLIVCKVSLLDVNGALTLLKKQYKQNQKKEKTKTRKIALKLFLKKLFGKRD